MTLRSTPMKRLFVLIGCGLWLTSLWAAAAAEPGDEVVVVYNKNLAESKQLAEYYAQRRQIPKDRVFGFDLPSTETMTRGEFESRLQKPLLKKLRDGKLFIYGSRGKQRSGDDTDRGEVPTE